MSGLKKAFEKLTHKDAAAAGNSSGSGSGAATPERVNSIDVSTAVNSPPASGQSTPVTHEKPHKSGGGGSGLLHFGHKSKEKDDKPHHHGDGAVARSNSLPRTGTEGCNDVQEHFKAIKKAIIGGGGAHKDNGKVSSDSARPDLVHHITEQDQRALKVDKQAELQQEQLRRELAYKEAYENDPLNGKYGFLNVDATPNAVDTSGKSVICINQVVARRSGTEPSTCRKQTFLEIAEKSEGDEVYFRARIQSVRHQSESAMHDSCARPSTHPVQQARNSPSSSSDSDMRRSKEWSHWKKGISRPIWSDS